MEVMTQRLDTRHDNSGPWKRTKFSTLWGPLKKKIGGGGSDREKKKKQTKKNKTEES